MLRSAAYDSLARVRDELNAARFAAATVAENWHQYQRAISESPVRLSIGDFRRLLQNVEKTFVLRLFATFEAVLRDFWAEGLGRRSDPELKRLMENIARRRNIDPATLAQAHAIRDYRNKIMHRNLQTVPFTYGECANAIAAYLSWLPSKW